MYAVTLRIPVLRVYPSDVEIPGKLFICISAFSQEKLLIGTNVTLVGCTCEAEVLQSNKTSRSFNDFKYEIAEILTGVVS